MKNVYTEIAKKYSGSFKDEISAAKAYDKAVKEKYGEYTHLNFPDE